MALHRFETTQLIAAPLEAAWAFFTDPRNLAAITPPDMGFEITSPVADRVYPGMIISYRVRPLLRVPVEWVTEITQVVERERFVDEQRIGPYRLWHHEHGFRAIGDMTEVHDLVSYALPFGPLGNLGYPLVRARVEHIFEYRAEVLHRRFGPRPEHPAAASALTAATA